MANTFDEALHEYRIDGVVVPSVTAVLHAVLPGWQADQWYLERGRAMHHGCRLLDEGRLDWATVSPEIVGRVKAWEKFRREYNTPILAREQPLYSSLYRFAGTVDAVFAEGVSEHLIVDLKSSYSPSAIVQVAAYSMLWDLKGTSAGRIVELRDDETYRCHCIDRPEMRGAKQTFLACLSVYSFMAKHNLLRKS